MILLMRENTNNSAKITKKVMRKQAKTVLKNKK